MNRYIIGALAAAAIGSAAPVFAQAFTVSSPAAEFAVPGNNDFQGNLAALGLDNYRTVGATVTLNFNRTLKFEYMGSESGLTNTFNGGSLPTFSEYDKSVWGPLLIGLQNFAAGNFTGASFNGGSVNIGDSGFGIFVPSNVARSYSSNVLYFGLDDFVNNADDNHDDFIVRVTAVPEPATWGMLVLGFGLIGASARRRAPKTVSA